MLAPAAVECAKMQRDPPMCIKPALLKQSGGKSNLPVGELCASVGGGAHHAHEQTSNYYLFDSNLHHRCTPMLLSVI